MEDFFNSKKAKDGKQSQCKACCKMRLSTPENVERRRQYAWLGCLQRFNLTEEQYDQMFEKQCGLCAICHKPDASGTRLAVDHDHECCNGDYSCGNCIRGLLCKKCNMGIGLLGDNPDTIANALLYVKGKR